MLRGEPGSITLQPKLHLGFMDPLLTHLPLVMKETSRYFRDQTAAFPNNKEVLGRVLGPARGAGNEMAQWILKANGRVIPRRSLRPLKVDELHSPVEIKREKYLMNSLRGDGEHQ